MGSFGRILRPKLPKPLNFSPAPAGALKSVPPSRCALPKGSWEGGQGMGRG